MANRISCKDLAAQGYDADKAAEEVWEALLLAGAMRVAPKEDPFIFASGLRATLKVNAEALDNKPRQQAVVLGHVATFPCVKDADVLLYVPEGMRNFTNILGKEMGKQVVQAARIPESASRYDFRYKTAEDEEMAVTAEHPTLLEDVVTTLGSVAGMVKIMSPENQDIHSLAFLLRGTVNPEYQIGLTDHYLVERKIPLEVEEFLPQLTESELFAFEQGLAGQQ